MHTNAARQARAERQPLIGGVDLVECCPPALDGSTLPELPAALAIMRRVKNTDRPPAPLTIATRESRLALWQAHHVRDVLVTQLGLQVELLGMTTRGDQILDRTLSKVGGKGLFVKELEAALEDGRAQLAVHSLKDVPMDMPPGFALAAVWAREDPRDAWVSSHYATLADLPQGAVVGTSSLRRTVQLLAQRPDLRIEPLRGNLDTRLRKLDEGGFDGIVLAAAGLMRLGLEERIRCRLDPQVMIPAAGQGALGIEIRADEKALHAVLAATSHRPTLLAVESERAVSRGLGGSCSMPLAAFAVWDGPLLRLSAALGDASLTQQPLLLAQVAAAVESEEAARALGAQAVSALMAQGATRYLPAS